MLTTQTIDSQAYRQIFTPTLNKLVELFQNHNYEIRIAGGAVRDILMGIVPHDIDFATTATPDQMKDMFTQSNVRMINSNGEKHGTITVRIDDSENFEITTLRIDLTTDGRHATVQYTQDWQLDANRRDLTINALFLDFKGKVYDYFNGIEDLENRRIRFVGDAVQRIQEDFLRILRYFRFFGRLARDGAEHEEETLKAIKENAAGLKNIAGERLWIELERIATGRNAGPVLRVLLEQGVGEYLGFPSNVDPKEIEEHWRQCFESKPHALTILMKLFRNSNELKIFEDRMKYSNDCRRLSQLILTRRDSISLLDSSSIDRLKLYKDLLLDLLIDDATAKDKIVELLKYQHHLDEISVFINWTIPRFPITGAHLASKGIKPGPMYKSILNELRQTWKRSHYVDDENRLLNEVLPILLENETKNVAPVKKQKN